MSKQLLLNKFFDTSTPSMRKGNSGEGKRRGKAERESGEGKRRGKAKRESGEESSEKTDENSGHYVIANSRPPDRRPLERRTLVPIS